MEVLKVSSKTNVNSLAGAIAEVIKTAGVAELSAIGAGAVNQAVKAIATAKGFLSPGGINIVCIPSFKLINSDTGEKTVMSIVVRKSM